MNAKAAMIRIGVGAVIENLMNDVIFLVDQGNGDRKGALFIVLPIARLERVGRACRQMIRDQEVSALYAVVCFCKDLALCIAKNSVGIAV